MRPAIFHPLAADELTAAAIYYENQQAGLGTRFHTEIKRLTAEIEISPHAFRIWKHGARRHFGPAFPYMLVYFERPTHLRIIAVAHFKQRPEYWHLRKS
ncbi:MAG: plasmid stabilization protein [Verrucomicrobia bacterium]|nr:plasmid stabilization protein [Verrucomicrobiota bacterium]